MVDRVKTKIAERNGTELDYPEEYALDAENLFFDSSAIDGVDADNLQELGEEVASQIGSSASPGFSFGRSASVSNAWLLITGSVPSNKTGIPVAILDGEVTLISVGNEDVSTFDVKIYEHEGDQVNMILLGTVSLINKRTDSFVVNYPVSTGKQIAARVTNGKGKNVGVILQLKGRSL